MLDSFVLRLVPSARVTGSMIGELEVVGSGEHLTIRSTAELLDALSRVGLSDDVVSRLPDARDGSDSPVRPRAPEPNERDIQ